MLLMFTLVSLITLHAPFSSSCLLTSLVSFHLPVFPLSFPLPCWSSKATAVTTNTTGSENMACRRLTGSNNLSCRKHEELRPSTGCDDFSLLSSEDSNQNKQKILAPVKMSRSPGGPLKTMHIHDPRWRRV